MKLEISEEILKDFVICVEKTFSKPKAVSFLGNDTQTVLYTAQDARQVSTVIAPQTKTFDVSVEATKFLQAAKSLYGGSMTLEFEPKAVVLSYGNARVRLPYITKEATWVYQATQAVQLSSEFYDALVHTLCIEDKDERFTGVLIDPLEEGTLVAKFSGTFLAMSRVEDLFPSRLIISSDFSKILKTKSEIEATLFSDRVFGLKTASGVSVTSSYMDTAYPEGFIESFGLSPCGSLVDFDKFALVYSFDVADLDNAVSLVSSVVGDEEFGITFKVEGKEASTGKYVWVVSSRSYKNLFAEEKLRSDGTLGEEPQTFKLHKKQLKKALANYTDKLILIDGKSFVLLSDETGNKVTLLSKLG